MSDFNPMWDKDKEPYEDFLERIPGHLQELLAEGKAYLAVPLDGFHIMQRYMDSVADENEFADFKAYVEGIETEDEAKQAVSDIASLEAVATGIANALLERRHELHIENCDTCKDLQSKGGTDKIKKALDRAKAAFMDAMSDDEDEEWKDSSEDPDAWRKA